MPTTRHPRHVDARFRITPVAIAAFATINEIRRAGADDAWEADGGRQRECLDAHLELFGELGLPPWHASPTDGDLAGPAPESMKGTAWAGTRAAALELRRGLLAAVAEQHKAKRKK
jgi:hypothetical protein